MKRSFLPRLRSALKSKAHRANGRRNPSDRAFSFEPLEPRLVFAVQLIAGSLPDLVTASPSPASNQFDVTTDLALPLASGGRSTSVTFDGQGLYQTTAPNLTVQSASFVPVDPSKTYALSGWARSGDEFGLRFQPNNLQSFGFTSYDKDHLEILPQHVLRYAGSTDTTLAAPLNPGDTTIHLTTAAGWSNAPTAAATTRGLAWYGYHDSTGTTYADFTYTRNVAMGGANGLWNSGAVTGNVIQLAAPWSGPALPAGAAVRDTGNGSDSNFAAVNSQAVPADWTWAKYGAIFGGDVLHSGIDSPTQFRPGTAFIRPTIVSNQQGGTANLISWGNVTVSEVPAGSTAAAFAPTIIDLSTVTGANQRQAFSSTGLYWGATLIKVDTSARYTISGRASNLADSEERPLGFVSFDIDKKLIEPLHVTKYAFAADSTLAAPLAPGDTSILLTNASGWSNDAWETADTRSLAWYGYADSTGHVYPNYTYTRNIAFNFDTGLWRPGAIHYDAAAGAYRINLITPWSGPALAAGAAIRNAGSGDTRNELRTSPAYDTQNEWAEYSATIGGGIWQDGQRSEDTFRPGTAYIEPLFTNTSAASYLTIAPVGNTVPATTAGLPTDHHVDLDLDVLAKIAAGIQSPAGDFNRNGVVDASDYVLWRKTNGATGQTPFSGADGNGDGKVDQADYQFWRANIGHASTWIIDSVTTPAHGTATVGGGANGSPVIHYRSDPWFVGIDVVSYTLKNTITNETKSLSVVIQVLGGNQEQNPSVVATLAAQAQTAGNVAPKALDDVYETAADQPLIVSAGHSINLLANDTDGTNTLVTRLLAGPSHGKLALNYDGTFTYAPEAGYSGLDSFRYEAFDGQFSEPAVATITVRAMSEDLILDQIRSVGLAILNYQSSLKRFPITTNTSYFDANGIPYLSWRVHVLPYIGYQSLYNQFHLNEPWDSPNNLPLADKMPDIFRNPGDTPTANTTRLSIISAEGAPYYWRRNTGLLAGPTSSNFTDGTTNTLLIVETGADKAVTWTKPDQMNFDPANPLAALGTLSSNIHAATADGATITLPASIDAATFKSLVTISGGELVDAGTLRRQYTEMIGGQAALQSFNVSTNYLKNIAIAMQNYADTRKTFPVAGSSLIGSSPYFDANGKPYLSWRVHLLPFLDQTALYNKFHLDEPWDSPNNLPLLSEMPDLFRSPGDSSNSTTTRLLTFNGKDAPFGYQAAGLNQTGPGFQTITDGTSQTIQFAEAGPDKAVPWTKPDDMPFDKNNPFASLGDLSTGKFRAAFFDAHISTFGADISPETLSALVTRAGRELVDSGSVETRETDRGLLPVGAATAVNDFRAVDIAAQDYDSSRTRFPASTFDATGKPLLSWRVLLLPFLEQSALYSQFHLNEPWDSPNNLALLSHMPDVYRAAGDPWDSGLTHVQGFMGTGAPFPATGNNTTRGLAFQSITDGSSKTILLAESGNTVPWSKPTDIPFDTNNPLSPLGDLGPNFVTAFFDGHVATQLSSISPDLLKAYITYNGGENTTTPPSINTVPNIYVSQSAGSTSLSEFGVDTVDVVLEKAPLSNVVISLTSTDASIATVDKPTLTFTATNWNLPQRVAVRGVDNHAINPDQLVNINVAVVAALSDDQYDGVAPQTVPATVLNDDFITADYNHSGAADAADYDAWRAAFAGNANAALAADGNLNGTVDASDYVLWRKNTPAAAAASGAELSFATSASASTEQLTSPVEIAFAQFLSDFSTAAGAEQQSRAVTIGASATAASDESLTTNELLLTVAHPATESPDATLALSAPAADPDPQAIDAAVTSALNQSWRAFD